MCGPLALLPFLRSPEIARRGSRKISTLGARRFNRRLRLPDLRSVLPVIPGLSPASSGSPRGSPSAPRYPPSGRDHLPPRGRSHGAGQESQQSSPYRSHQDPAWPLGLWEPAGAPLLFPVSILTPGTQLKRVVLLDFMLPAPVATAWPASGSHGPSAPPLDPQAGAASPSLIGLAAEGSWVLPLPDTP